MSKHKRELIGSCIDNPFGSVDTLSEIIDKGVQISRQYFLRKCDVPYILQLEFKRWEHDYTFYRSGKVYFYQHSRVEYFYQKPKTERSNNESNSRKGNIRSAVYA